MCLKSTFQRTTVSLVWGRFLGKQSRCVEKSTVVMRTHTDTHSGNACGTDHPQPWKKQNEKIIWVKQVACKVLWPPHRAKIRSLKAQKCRVTKHKGHKMHDCNDGTDALAGQLVVIANGTGEEMKTLQVQECASTFRSGCIPKLRWPG